MTKLKNLSLLAAALMAGLLFNSCTGDAEKGGGKDGADYGTAYFSVKFTGAKGAGTRADEAGNVYEQMIDGVYILLYNTDGTKALKYAWTLDVTNINTTNDGLAAFAINSDSGDLASGKTTSTSNFTSVGKEVEAQAYYMVVVANPGKYTSTFTYNSDATGTVASSSNAVYNTITTLTDALSGIDVNEFGATFGAGAAFTNNKFFMSNANGPVTVPVGKLKGTQVDAENDPVSVKIDRLLAKVMVKEPLNGALVVETATSNTSIGTVSNLKWSVKNVNTKTFLYRHAADVSAEITGPETDGTDRQYIYATDPNMSASVTNEFANGAAGLNWIEYGETEDIYAYVFENTFEKAAQTHVISSLKGYATYLEITANISLDALGAVAGYYSYSEGGSWRTFSWAQANSWNTNDDFPHNMGTLKATIAGLDTSATEDKIFDFAAASDPTTGYTGTDIYSILSSNGTTIYYHPAGLNRYALPIEHFAYDSDDYGYYGVVRNNVYKVTINKIVGPGNTAADTGWLAATIHVNPWFIRDQGAVITPERP